MTTATVGLVPKPETKKSAQELEIERLMALTAKELTNEDLAMLGRLSAARKSLAEIDATLEDVKETRKLRQAALESAVYRASMHFENRQMALNFGGAS